MSNWRESQSRESVSVFSVSDTFPYTERVTLATFITKCISVKIFVSRSSLHAGRGREYNDVNVGCCVCGFCLQIWLGGAACCKNKPIWIRGGDKILGNGGGM